MSGGWKLLTHRWSTTAVGLFLCSAISLGAWASTAGSNQPAPPERPEAATVERAPVALRAAVGERLDALSASVRGALHLTMTRSAALARARLGAPEAPAPTASVEARELQRQRDLAIRTAAQRAARAQAIDAGHVADNEAQGTARRATDRNG